MHTLLAFMLAGPATADTAGGERPFSVTAGLGAVAGPATAQGVSAGGNGFARLVAGRGALALDVGGRTGIIANDLREATTISAGLRWAPRIGERRLAYTRLGFVHNHETPWDVLMADPFGSAIGSGEGIRHRSGAELALGGRATLLPHETDGRWSAFAELSVQGFPDDGGPHVYGGVDTGVAYAFGRAR